MPVYISMLRGINVGGHNKVPMATLRESLKKLGFQQVKTYVQSGNIVFKTVNTPSAALSQKIEKAILEDFGFPVSVITRTADEMGNTIQNNPFLREKGIDVTKLHVTFLSQSPDKELLKKLAPLAVPPDQFRHVAREIYLCCPNGYGQTKLNNNALERNLSLKATTRNWRTVNQLYQMAQE